MLKKILTTLSILGAFAPTFAIDLKFDEKFYSYFIYQGKEKYLKEVVIPESKKNFNRYEKTPLQYFYDMSFSNPMYALAYLFHTRYVDREVTPKEERLTNIALNNIAGYLILCPITKSFRNIFSNTSIAPQGANGYFERIEELIAVKDPYRFLIIYGERFYDNNKTVKNWHKRFEQVFVEKEKIKKDREKLESQIRPKDYSEWDRTKKEEYKVKKLEKEKEYIKLKFRKEKKFPEDGVFYTPPPRCKDFSCVFNHFPLFEITKKKRKIDKEIFKNNKNREFNITLSGEIEKTGLLKKTYKENDLHDLVHILDNLYLFICDLVKKTNQSSGV